MKLLYFLIFMAFGLLSFLLIERNPGPKNIIDLLENYYANLDVNGAEQKHEILKKIKTLPKDQLTNFDKLKPLIVAMHDGHLRIQKMQNNLETFNSGIEFLWDNDFYLLKAPGIKTAELPAKIMLIDNEPLDVWLEEEVKDIFASTKRGRLYKALNLLKENKNKQSAPQKIDLLLKSGATMAYDLHWEMADLTKNSCVSGEKIDDSTYKLQIKTLWCQKNINESRTEILNNFKNEFNEQFYISLDYPRIILDLRGNGGGGEGETIHVLLHTIPVPTFLFHYQYLNKNLPFPKNLINRENKRWQKAVKENITPGDNNYFSRDKRKIVVLIDQGCSSSCEVLASIYRTGAKFPLVGFQTHGSAGDPLDWQIPDTDIIVTFPSLVNFQEDGSLYEGVGVTPTYVGPFDLTQNDPLLKRALEILERD